MASGLTYKNTGVDIEAGGKFAATIQTLMRRTYGPRVLDLPDGFAGLCALSGAGLLPRRYRDPILAACTDSVGTKVKIAFLTDKHDTIGIDVVAMCVNDLIAVGAEPLIFLDYIGTHKVDRRRLPAIVKGVSQGCVQANCALIGGETAEMPDLYAPGEYDLAGFCAGLVERRRIIRGRRIKPNDVVIGMASTGLHSNGYTLVRKVFFDRAKMSVDDPVAELGCTLGEELLRPTQIYVRAVSAVLAHYKVKHIVHGVAHITGGGLPQNITRILPDRCHVRIKKGSWPVPPIFPLVKKLGKVAEEEMCRVFNMGIGMALIVPAYNAPAILRILKRHKQPAWVIGEVRRGPKGVTLAG